MLTQWMRYELPFKEQLALVTKNMLMIRRKKKVHDLNFKKKKCHFHFFSFKNIDVFSLLHHHS